MYILYIHVYMYIYMYIYIYIYACMYIQLPWLKLFRLKAFWFKLAAYRITVGMLGCLHCLVVCSHQPGKRSYVWPGVRQCSIHGWRFVRRCRSHGSAFISCWFHFVDVYCWAVCLHWPGKKLHAWKEAWYCVSCVKLFVCGRSCAAWPGLLYLDC